MSDRVLDSLAQGSHAVRQFTNRLATVRAQYSNILGGLTGVSTTSAAHSRASRAVVTHCALKEVADSTHVSPDIDDIVDLPEVLRMIYQGAHRALDTTARSEQTATRSTHSQDRQEDQAMFVQHWLGVARELPAAKAAVSILRGLKTPASSAQET